MPARCCALLLAVLTGSAAAYERGDPVHAARRSLHNQWKTEWTDLLPAQTPRFGESAVFPLKLDFDAKGTSASEAFKIALAFADERFVTPWITLWDGKGAYAQEVVVKFYFAGRDILRVHHDVVMSPSGAPANSRPGNVFIQYEWEEAAAQDPRAGFRMLLLAGVVFTLLPILAVLVTADGPAGAGAPSRERRPVAKSGPAAKVQ